jgi:glyoxylase-like metal-dependent hydrolase (beta-lactamase superfamily II)/ferredoxin
MTQRRAENTDGPFYVDGKCINCGTCYWMAPKTFKELGSMSAVYAQPKTPEDTRKVLQALLSCPVGSIHSEEKQPTLSEVIKEFPLPVAENVYHCGFHSEKSYGAASYFIKRPEGNILVDSPRFAAPLVKRFEELGGIKYLYLTHQDDVADHQQFKAHFNCEEIIHEDDYRGSFGKIDIVLKGQNDFKLAEDLTIIPVPGHTKGHTVLLYNKFLFTGDHLAWDEDLGHLSAFKDACWYSWEEQTKSMARLLNYSFQWVLPGHGERYHTNSHVMQEQVEKCIKWMSER